VGERSSSAAGAASQLSSLRRPPLHPRPAQAHSMMVCERRGRARRVGARRAETLRHVEHELQTLRETHAATAADLRSAEAERASLERQLQDTVSGARQALAELQETQRTREEGVAQLRALQLTSDRLRTSVDAAEGQLQQREAELRHREAEMRSVQEQVGGGDQQPPPPPPISTCLCPAAPPRRSPCWCWWRVWPFLPRAVRRPAVLFEQRTRAGPRGGGGVRWRQNEAYEAERQGALERLEAMEGAQLEREQRLATLAQVPRAAPRRPARCLPPLRSARVGIRLVCGCAGAGERRSVAGAGFAGRARGRGRGGGARGDAGGGGDDGAGTAGGRRQRAAASRARLARA
jgi:hypothetical protein